MKSCFNLKFIGILFILLFVLFPNNFLYSQTPRFVQPKDCAVMVTAQSQKSPPAIILTWIKNDIVESYEIYRKLKDEQYWSGPIGVVDSNTTIYIDYDVKLGNAYEYMVKSIQWATVTLDLGLGGNPTYATNVWGFGYIYAGAEADPIVKGRVILLVDETVSAALPDEIDTLKSDMVNEGWAVVERVVPRTEKFDGAAVKNVKSVIVEEYNRDSVNTNTVFILGRVAVPYSGDMNKNLPSGGVTNATDAHPNHCGAWPADVYYGSLNESDWQDNSVYDTLGYRQENWNKIGDGKFDLTQLVTDVTLGVGRVDFYNMPSFSKSEIELYRNYLKRDHDYRTGNIAVVKRGIVSDSLGWLSGENPGQNAWRNFPPFVSSDSVIVKDWLPEITNNSYLWGYACQGSGSTNCGNILNTAQCTQNPLNIIFAMMFGSYFGDWDFQNDVMRATLCANTPILLNSWAGRPSWYFHHMALGVPAGFSTKISQNNYPKNNNFLYYANGYIIQQDPYKGYSFTNQAAPGFVSMALMGDPTLTMYYNTVEPPSNLSLYKPAKNDISLSWNKSVSSGVDGYYIYSSISNDGSFTQINSKIVTDTIFNDSIPHDGTIYYMVKAAKLTQTFSGSFYNTSRGIIKSIIVSGVEEQQNLKFSSKCSPNPANSYVDVTLILPLQTRTSVEIFDINGNKVNELINMYLFSGSHQFSWNLTNFDGKRVSPGIYLMKIFTIEKTDIQKIIVLP